MKNSLRILIACAVATMFIGGGLAGSAAAQDTNFISDDDLVDVNVNAGNPTTALAVNAGNVGSGDSSAAALAESDQNAGDSYEQEIED